MKVFRYMAAAAACCVSGVAVAAPTPTFLFTPGVYSPTATTASVFEDFGPVVGVGTGPFTTRTNTFATESSTGSATIVGGTTSTSAVNPDGGADNYLAIGGNSAPGTFTVDFTKGGAIASAVQYFSFAFGSLDSYNTLTLNYSDGSIFLSGLGISTGNAANNTVAGTAPTSFAGGTITGRLNIYGSGNDVLNSVVFGSSQAAFEIDSLAAATPEPGTWAMMILGFGLAGTALRMRRRKATIAFA